MLREKSSDSVKSRSGENKSGLKMRESWNSEQNFRRKGTPEKNSINY